MSKEEYDAQMDLIGQLYEDGKQAVYDTTGPIMTSVEVDIQNRTLYSIRRLRDIAAETTTKLYHEHQSKTGSENLLG